MGYTILLQWTTPSTRQPVQQTEIILTRVLEHYQIQYTTRTTIPIIMYRTKAKTLSLYRYHWQNREQGIADDIGYLFLEDKTPAGEGDVINGDGNSKAKGSDQEVNEEESGPTNEPDHKDQDKVIQEKPKGGERKRKRNQYQTLAVRPSGSVVSMLSNLLNPFVMGVTKSARQAASTTAQKATPTALPGHSITVSGYQFPTLPEPFPPITLTIHTPQTTASRSHTVLEAEYNGYLGDVEVVGAILKEFLAGCIPDGAGGEHKWWTWTREDGDGDGIDGWEGTERQRKVTQLLGRCMREGAIL